MSIAYSSNEIHFLFKQEYEIFIDFVILVTFYFTAIEIKITGVKVIQINNFDKELIQDKSNRACTIVIGYKLNCLQSDFNRPKNNNNNTNNNFLCERYGSYGYIHCSNGQR